MFLGLDLRGETLERYLRLRKTKEIQGVLPKKRCGICMETKSLDDFHIDSSKSDGRRTFCKACRALQKRIKLGKIEKMSLRTLRDDSNYRCCRSCGMTKLLRDEFYTDPDCKLGYSWHCKTCSNRRGKRYRSLRRAKT